MGGGHSKHRGCHHRIPKPKKHQPQPRSRTPPPAQKTRVPTRDEIIDAIDKDQYAEDRTRMLGKGAFGEVYVCRLTNPLYGGHEIVGKMMQLISPSDAGIKAAQQEFELLSNFTSSPNIVEVYATDYDEEKKELWIFMEKLVPFPKRLLSQTEALRYFQQVASALHLIHHTYHLVHADIKPENVLLDANNEVKLVDFGISKAVHAYIGATMATLTGTTALHGARLINTAAMCTSAEGFTPLYAPPEQFPPYRGGKELLKTSCDIFALGCLYVAWVEGVDRLIARRRDIDMKTVCIKPDVSVNIDGLPNFVCRCLQLKPEDRPTAQELAK